MQLQNIKLVIIGLGYVGLPLAVEFGRNRQVIGFDINQRRIDKLKSGTDVTLETTQEELAAAKHLTYTTNIDDLRACNCYIVTVPTPIDKYKRPDLTPLIKASEIIGKVLQNGGIPHPEGLVCDELMSKAKSWSACETDSVFGTPLNIDRLGLKIRCA